MFTEEDPTYDDVTETNSVASGSVNEILDGVADVQEFRDSVDLDQHLHDLQIPDSPSASDTELVSTIKRKPYNKSANNREENQGNTGKNMSYTESDFINQAFAGGGSGKLSRSNSGHQLTNSVSGEMQKVIISDVFKLEIQDF